MAYTLSYKCDYKDVLECTVQMEIPDGADIHEFLGFVQRFMVAAGYVFDDDEEIVVDKRESATKNWDDFGIGAAQPVPMWGGSNYISTTSSDTISFG